MRNDSIANLVRTHLGGALLAAGLIAAGCSTGARQGAATGGLLGFVGGAAAGAVDGLLFGGNPWEGALEAGLAGAAGGAAMGAASGGMNARKGAESGSQRATPSDQQIEKLRKKQGDLNFQAAALLVQCRHDQAIDCAQRAFTAAETMERKIFALTIQAVCELESGQADKAEATYARVVATDPERNLDQARADTLQAMLKIQQIRKEQGLENCQS